MEIFGRQIKQFVQRLRIQVIFAKINKMIFSIIKKLKIVTTTFIPFNFFAKKECNMNK